MIRLASLGRRSVIGKNVVRQRYRQLFPGNQGDAQANCTWLPSALACLLAVAGVLAFSIDTIALASTIPPVDLEVGTKYLSVGIADIGIDFVPWDGVPLGASVALVPAVLYSWTTIMPVVAGRITRRLGRNDWASIGLTLSAGIAIPGVLVVPWIQPALNVSLGKDEGILKVRGTIGPVIGPGIGYYGGSSVVWIPNVELALQVVKDAEFTIGGNSLAGVRWKF